MHIHNVCSLLRESPQAGVGCSQYGLHSELAHLGRGQGMRVWVGCWNIPSKWF